MIQDLPPFPDFDPDVANGLRWFGWHSKAGAPWFHDQTRVFLPWWIIESAPSSIQVDALRALPPLGGLLHVPGNWNAKTSIWMAACADSDADRLIPVLVELGADVNHFDAEGDTALLDACRKEGPLGARTVAALLAAGADVDLTRNGAPVGPGRLGAPILVAAHNNLAAVQLLLEAGADPEPLRALLERRPRACLPGTVELVAPFVQAAALRRAVSTGAAAPPDRPKVRL